MLGLQFCYDFFLELESLIALLYSIDTVNLTGQHISKKEKNPCFIVHEYMPASYAGPSSVTSGLRMTIRPVKPVPPCIEELKESLLFPKCCRFDPSSSIKLL